MSRKTILMFVLTAVAIVLWALRFIPSLAMPVNLSDFAGGMSIGLAIGTVFTWISER